MLYQVRREDNNALVFETDHPVLMNRHEQFICTDLNDITLTYKVERIDCYVSEIQDLVNNPSLQMWDAPVLIYIVSDVP